ncbi:MAG: LytTR family transcriptional regulator [Clostridia bacterium]|nr:LytTR family transcriptional regulator [Clostridia bacterium]
MKVKVFIDDRHEEEVLVYAHSRNEFVQAIERLAEEERAPLLGHRDGETVPLKAAEVCCFIAEDSKVYAVMPQERLQVRCRLYTLEERLPTDFLKIHKSCIANLRRIRRFRASLGGALMVEFEGGHTEYVSRRQMKVLKERLGL